MTKKWTFLGIFIGMLGLTACGLTSHEGSKGTAMQLEIETNRALPAVTDDALISQADAIFLGRVDWVGATVWTDGAAQHQIAVSVLQSLVDEANMGSGGILTIAGPSPIDTAKTPTTAAMQLANQASHHLQIGDEMIFLVKQTEVNANGRSQSILAPLSNTSQSFLSADLLNDLIVQVQLQRPLLVNPANIPELGV